MAVITPPADFWPLTTGLGTGVNTAVPPLFISGTTIAMTAATDVHEGYVTTSDQPYGGIKNFTDGIKLNTGVTVTDISTDGTMAAASDSKLATQKAVKDYVDNYGSPIDSVVNPLYINLQALKIYDATGAQSGVITTGTQTFAGAKTFTTRSTFVDGLTANSDIRIANVPADILSYSDSAELRLWASAQDDYSGSTTGLVSVFPNSSVTDPGAVRCIPANGRDFRVMHTPGLLIPPSEIFSVTPSAQRMKLSYDGSNYTTFTATSGGILTVQPTSATMRLAYDGSNYVDFVCSSAGDLTINSSGNDVVVQTSDKFSINNNTANNGTLGTGALIVAGGGSFGAQSGFFGGLRSTFVVSPTVRTDLANTPLVMFAGTNPVYQAAQGAMITLQDLASGGYCDINATAGKDIRFYTGAVPPLSLALSIKPTTIDASTGVVTRFYNTTQSTASTNGCVILDGGLGVAKDIRCAGTIYGTYSPAVPLVLTGAPPQIQLKYTGGTQTASAGVDVNGDLALTTTTGRSIATASGCPFRVYNTTAAATPDTGAAIIEGGLLVKGNVLLSTAVYRDKDLLACAREAPTLAPPFLITYSVFGNWTFPASGQNYLHASCSMPVDAAANTSLTIKVHYYGTTAPGGNDLVKLILDWQMGSAGGDFLTITPGNSTGSYVLPAAGGVYQCTTVATIATSYVPTTPYAMRFRFGRDATDLVNDTYTGTLILLGWSMSYQVNALGRSTA